MSSKVTKEEDVEVGEWPDDEEEEMEFGYAVAPETAVIGGFVVMAVTKIWVNQNPRRGFTTENSFMRELLLAIPIRREVDKEQLPEGCLTVEEFRTLISGMIDALKENREFQ